MLVIARIVTVFDYVNVDFENFGSLHSTDVLTQTTGGIICERSQ